MTEAAPARAVSQARLETVLLLGWPGVAALGRRLVDPAGSRFQAFRVQCHGTLLPAASMMAVLLLVAFNA